MIISIYVCLFFASLLALTSAGRTTEHGKRGVARIMDFGDYNGLDKRDRGTW